MQDINSLIQQAKRLKEVKELAQGGKMLEAIKLYRQITDAGLKEAKDAVEAMMRGEPVQINTVFTTTENSDASEQAEKLKEVLRLSVSGKKIEAIKIFREATGVGLKEAKDAVEAMTRNENVTIKTVRTENITDQTQVMQEVIRLAREGKKIDAIKVLRQATKMGLKEAKDIVDALDRGEQVSIDLPPNIDDEPIIKIQSTTASNSLSAPPSTGFGLGSSSMSSTQEVISPLNFNGCAIGLILLVVMGTIALFVALVSPEFSNVLRSFIK